MNETEKLRLAGREQSQKQIIDGRDGGLGLLLVIVVLIGVLLGGVILDNRGLGLVATPALHLLFRFGGTGRTGCCGDFDPGELVPEEVAIIISIAAGFRQLIFTQTPGRIQKVDPLMGVRIKYP